MRHPSSILSRRSGGAQQPREAASSARPRRGGDTDRLPSGSQWPAVGRAHLLKELQTLYST